MYQETMSDVERRAVVVVMDGVDGAGVALLFAVIRDFGNSQLFLYGQSYWRSLMFFVPRSIYPDKPPNFPVVLASIYAPGETTSLSATVLGELYANFSLVGVALLPLITFGLVRASYAMGKTNRGRVLSRAVGFVFLLHAVRFGISVVAVDYLIAIAIGAIWRWDRTLVPGVLRRPASFRRLIEGRAGA
jgi:hypothetical protein